MTETVTNDAALAMRCRTEAAVGTDQEARDWLRVTADRLSWLSQWGKARWIPTSERLPRNYVHVIAYPEGARRAVEMWRTDNDVWMMGDFIPVKVVTHWMPLPEPPADVAEQT